MNLCGINSPNIRFKISKDQTQHPEFSSATVYCWKSKKKRARSQKNMHAARLVHKSKSNLCILWDEGKDKVHIYELCVFWNKESYADLVIWKFWLGEDLMFWVKILYLPPPWFKFFFHYNGWILPYNIKLCWHLRSLYLSLPLNALTVEKVAKCHKAAVAIFSFAKGCLCKVLFRVQYYWQ